MEFRRMPGTSLQVSMLSLGTMMFGGQTNETDSLAIMDYACGHGINFIDTANAYNHGESERIVGKGLKGRRHSIILATKVRWQMSDDPNDAGLSRRHILSAVDASLDRLNTDYIDLYYMHAPDHATGIAESLETMSSLVKSGKVRYIGVSNYAAWQIADMLSICDKHHFVPPFVTQNIYNLITRGIEAELVPFLQAHNMGMTIYNPIAAGLLSGKHKSGIPAENTRFSFNKNYFDRYWMDENFAAVEKLERIALAHGLSILQLALKWCAAQKHVTSIISGVSRLAQIEQNIESIEGEPLNALALAQCDEIWRSLAGNRAGYIK